MSETSKSLFYNSENGDRVYDADSFEHLLKKFFTSGVFTGSCQVTADGTGMTCSVGMGYANCDGKIRLFDSAAALSFDNAHATYNRIDTVVVERNDTDREITVKVVKGTYSATPAATAPVRTNGVYQLVLAEVYIAAGATAISQSVITDKRPDTDVCGYVISAVQTPDFSELYDQFLEQAEEFIDTNTSEFIAWFNEMKNQLSEDAAGHLQLEIDGINELIGTVPEGEDLQGEITNNAAIGDALAIVINGDTAPRAITSGQYLFIKNHSTLPSGGYHATANISSGASITSSNVAADADGIANAINGKITPNNITSSLTKSASLTIQAGGVNVIGKLVVVNIRVYSSSAVSAGTTIISGLPIPFDNTQGIVVCSSNDKNMLFIVTKEGSLNIASASSSMIENVQYQIDACYVKG